MNEKQTDKREQLAREKTLYMYANALERGDFETLEIILEQAVHDLVLEQMIFELHDAYNDEQETAHADDAATVREIIREHLLSGLITPDEDVEIPPLTVSDVCASLQTKAAIQGRSAGEVDVKALTEQLRQNQTPLPEELTGRKLRQFFAQLGISVSDRFQDIFREAAIFLSVSREQDLARLSAARRQSRQRSRTMSFEKQKGAQKK